MIRQLVILGSGITALAVVRSAHRLGVKPIVFDTEQDIATASRLAHVETHPGQNREEVIPRLAALGRESPSALISTADAWLRVLVAHRAQLELAYDRVLHPGNDALGVCLNKERFALWSEANALPAPKLYRIGPEFLPDACTLPFPLLLRPADTLHSNATAEVPKASQVRSPAALARRLEEFRRASATPALSQSLLGRQLTQYSVGLARAGGRTMTFVARKLRPLPEACAAGTLVETTEQPEVERLARRAATLLDYEGIAEIEVLRDEASGENFLVEINARPWLQFALGAVTGRDLLGFVLSDGAATGNPAPARRRGLWLDFHADLRVCFGRNGGLVPAGRLAFADYIRSLARANVFARWWLADMGPFWRDAVALVAARFRHMGPIHRRMTRSSTVHCLARRQKW